MCQAEGDNNIAGQGYSFFRNFGFLQILKNVEFCSDTVYIKYIKNCWFRTSHKTDEIKVDICLIWIFLNYLHWKQK